MTKWTEVRRRRGYYRNSFRDYFFCGDLIEWYSPWATLSWDRIQYTPHTRVDNKNKQVYYFQSTYINLSMFPPTWGGASYLRKSLYSASMKLWAIPRGKRARLREVVNTLTPKAETKKTSLCLAIREKHRWGLIQTQLSHGLEARAKTEWPKQGH